MIKKSRLVRMASGLVVGILLILSLGQADNAQAQDPIIWSKPENLSLSPTSSRHPAIVADDFGHVHVFWSEDVRGEDLESYDGARGGIAIMYMRWDGKRWTIPVDILVSPGDARADFVAVDMGADGQLHAVWGGQSDFYYSSANGWEAENPNAWRPPIVIAGDNARSTRESGITVDEEGTIHIIYATGGSLAGVYHISSADGGLSWIEEKRISTGLSPIEAGLANVRIVDDSSGRLHATWQTYEEAGFGQGVYYSRSLDSGQTWEEPTRFKFSTGDDNFVALPYITAGANDELHLVYVDGNDKRRAYRTSMDGGDTWSEPGGILTDMEGVNGYVFPVLDANGRIYMIANMRTQAGQIVGIYYSYQLVQGDWSQTKPADVTSQGSGYAHSTAAAVRLGNEIHVVYNEFVENEIWYVRGEIQDVEQAEPLPVPVSLPVAGQIIEEPATITQTVESANESPIKIDTVVRPTEGSPNLPIIVGAGAALLLVMVTLLLRARKR